MIKSKDDLKYYIKCDLKAMHIDKVTLKMKIKKIFYPETWSFVLKMRKMEYKKNCKKGLLSRIFFKFSMIRFNNYSHKLGFSIPLNVFGPGLNIAHIGNIVINEHCKFGKNARIHVGVNIGNYSKFDENWRPDNVPVFGDNVYIGPGAKLFGKITIGNDVAIGANSVVTKDVEDHVTVAGVPAKVINNNGSKDMIIYAAE